MVLEGDNTSATSSGAPMRSPFEGIASQRSRETKATSAIQNWLWAETEFNLDFALRAGSPFQQSPQPALHQIMRMLRRRHENRFPVAEFVAAGNRFR